MKAVDKGTGKEQHITIQGSGALSEDEIKRMQKEAEVNAEADKTRKEMVESRNQLDGMVYTAEKTIKDAGEKAEADDVKALEEGIAAAKELLVKKDATKDDLEKHASELSEKMQKVGAALYKDMPGAEGSPEEVEATEDEGKTAEGPVEGEVVDEGDDAKSKK